MRRITLVLLSAGALTLSLYSIDAGAAPPKASSGVTVLPVLSCPTSYGAGGRTGVFVAKSLPANTSVRGLRFYSNGLNTVLAPKGWKCGALDAADGGQALVAFPPGKPNYSVGEAPKGAQLVEVSTDYTGHLPGEELVCGLFPHSAAAAQVHTSGLRCDGPSSREHIVNLTDDTATFLDPPRVSGLGAASGGALPTYGAAVYPQVSPAPQSVDVATLSCSLPARDAGLCRAIENDFLIRYTPVDEGTITNN